MFFHYVITWEPEGGVKIYDMFGAEYEIAEDGYLCKKVDDKSEDSSSDIEASPMPNKFQLFQNYPNPFNAATAINFSLPEPADVNLVVCDMLGRRVRELADGHLSAGHHTIDWDSRDDRGEPVASGMYFYRLTAGDFSETRKMVLMK